MDVYGGSICLMNQHVAQPVTEFESDALHALVADLLDTMPAANGAGLAAPQIGVDLQMVIFGSGAPSPRYPDAPIVPRMVLCNPVIAPLGEEEELGWEGCLSVPGPLVKTCSSCSDLPQESRQQDRGNSGAI